MNEPKHIMQHLEEAKQRKQFYEDSTNTKETKENDVVYPEWVNNIFLMFALNYDRMWSDTMPDKKIEDVKKIMWMDALKNFLPETIMRAAKQVMLDCPTYPPRVGDMFKLCEEFSKTNRYNESQISYQRQGNDDARKVKSDEAKKALADIRDFVKSVGIKK